MKKSIIILFVLSYSILGIAQKSNVQRISDNIKYLASDELKGRFPGTDGDIKSAEFIRNHFKNAGCKLLFDDGFQYFKIVNSVKFGTENSLIINDSSFIIKEDYTPSSFSPNNELTLTVAFVGYGFIIDTDTLKWDDYKNIDVNNKWVMILRGDPEIDNPFSNYITISEDRNKVMIAKDHGAKGVIFVSGEIYNKKDELVSLNYDKTSGNSGIPVIHIKRSVANKLLEKYNKNIADIERQLNTSHSAQSFDLNDIIKSKTSIEYQKIKTQNVLGMIAGTDSLLSKKYIIIGAHYDHLGMGGEGSSSRQKDTIAVHNGADDNASGVAGVIELAYLFGKHKPKYSIIFMTFGAEEMGLLGSKYYVNNTKINIEDINTMLNFDMIGRFNNETKTLSIGGTGTSIEADSLINLSSENFNFTIKKNSDGYGPSDHSSFYTNNIPVFFISTGAHSDYHTPFDDYDRINILGESEVINFSYQLVNNINNNPEPLNYLESDSPTKSRKGRRMKVTLGIIPDFSNQDTKGLGIDGIKKGGPADGGGLKKGDIIVAINGLQVTNIYDYMYRLNTLNPGETAIIEVLRNNKKVVLLVQL